MAVSKHRLWEVRAVFLLAVAALVIPACGSSSSNGGPLPAPGAPPLPAGVTQLQGGYTLTTFAVGPAGSTKPDSILQVGNFVYVTYQNQLNSDGTTSNPPGTGPQGITQLVQYDLSGNLIRTINITGHNDGMMLYDSDHLWVMSNEDSNPYLNIVTLSTGVVALVYPTGGVPPNPPVPTLHGGGYDDMIMIDGVVYVSCSNPTTPGTGPLVVTLTLHQPGGATFDVASAIAGNVGANSTGPGATDSVWDATADSQITSALKFTDPDSMALAPNGDLMVSGQADSTLAFIHSPGVPNNGVGEFHQFVNIIPVTLGGNPWPVDDTRFAPSGSSFMLVTDTGANTIYRVDPPAGGFLTGTPSSAAGVAFKGTAYSAGNGGIYSLDLPTGSLYPIFTGLKTPHGMRFITPAPTVPSTVTVLDPNYSISLFAQAPAGSSKPDSIVQLQAGGPNGDIFIGYQGPLNHDGTIPPNAAGTGPQGIVSVVQYDTTGKLKNTYPIRGHVDGIVEINPASAVDGSNLWILSNEDANPVLTTIITATGVTTQYAPNPAQIPTNHGGGYDDLAVIGGKVYISCSNPNLPVTNNQVVGQLTISLGPNQFSVTPVVLQGVATYDPVGLAISGKFGFTDPDSEEITPNGDLLVDGQADGAVAIIPKAQLTAGLPPTTAATIAAGAAGLTTNGKHSGFVTFVSAAGESLASPASNQLTVAGNTQISWTAIPLGPAGTTSRKLYMTVAGDTGLPLYTGMTIPNNTAVVAVTNVADAGLGAAAPVVTVLNVTLYGNPLPADDTRYVPVANPQFLLMTDPSANQTYKITSTAAWVAGAAFDAGAISVNTLNTGTGVATPIITGFKAPHGLLFVK